METGRVVALIKALGSGEITQADIINALSYTPANDSSVVHIANSETITGSKTFGAGLYGTAVAMSSGDVDVSTGTVFTKTISAATTITFTGEPASGSVACVTLILTNGGAYTVTWDTAVKWSSGTAPDLTASGVDVLTFLTVNGGTTWYGTVNSLGVA